MRQRTYASRSLRDFNVHSGHSGGDIGQPDALAHEGAARLAERLQIARGGICGCIFDHAQRGRF